MKRVLIICYYWPPSAGSGVQRWLKFSKYLPENGWQPVIYTPKNPGFDLKDEALLKDIPQEAEILKQAIWEPYSLHQKLLGGKKKGKAETNVGIVGSDRSNWKNYLSNWIRGNLFIPDPKKFWVKPSVKFLLDYLEKHPVDAVVSTGPPHSMHLIAKGICEKRYIPWIADFRDPWSKLDMLDSYHISARNYKKYVTLEKSVIEKADISLTTSEVWKEDFIALGAKRAEYITNGFDDSDLSISVEPYSNFVISHFGLLNHLRNPEMLWAALNEICETSEDFKKDLRIHLGGSIDQNNLNVIRSFPQLKEALVLFEYISHQEVVVEYLKSSVLLLLLFNSESGVGNIPGKLFEYLAAKVPIVAFGPGSGDSKRIIEETKAGYYHPYEANKETLKEQILSLYENHKSVKLNAQENAAMVKKYSRKSLTKDLSLLLEELIANPAT